MVEFLVESNAKQCRKASIGFNNISNTNENDLYLILWAVRRYSSTHSLNDMDSIPLSMLSLTSIGFAGQKRLLLVSVVCLGLHGWLFTLPFWQSRADRPVTLPIPAALSVSLGTTSRLPPAADPVAEMTQSVVEKKQAVEKTKTQRSKPADNLSTPAKIKRPSLKKAQIAKAVQPSSLEVAAAPAAEIATQPRFRVPPSPPHYPQAARQRRQEGTAIVEVQLDISGAVQRISLQHSSGFALLDRAALQAAGRWQYLPRTVNGQGVAHTVRIPVRFNLT
jgi:protein TonB